MKTKLSLRPTSRPATNRQLEIYEWLFEQTRRNGFQPTFREVAEHFSHGGTNGVKGHLAALTRRGYLAPTEKQQARALRLLKWPDGTPFDGFATCHGGNHFAPLNTAPADRE